jgi:hypothetical protein
MNKAHILALVCLGAVSCHPASRPVSSTMAPLAPRAGGVEAPIPASHPAPTTATAVRVEQIDFHGWTNAWKISHAACELIVVPQVSRVMSFRLSGHDNVFWINDRLAGQSVPADDGQWHNFGGEKLWPTQQSLWPQYTANAWPPPYPYDSGPASAEALPDGLRLSTAFDPHFGAHAVREFHLDPIRPLVRIHQYHQKTAGDPLPMTLWSITQVRTPRFAMLPPGVEVEGKSYLNLLPKPPLNVTVHKDVISLHNNDQVDQKIGVVPQAGRQEGWVAAVFADQQMLVLSHRIRPDGVYPDGGCDAEVYTAPASTVSYVEMELLSPLRTIKKGQMLADDAVWTLVPIDATAAIDPEHAAKTARTAHREALQMLQRP